MNLALLNNKAIVLFDMWDISHWQFKLDKADSRLGICKFRKKTISLSEYHATHDTAEQVLDTLKHEIAHALDYIRNGTSDGHGERWKSFARLVGCSPEACTSTAVGVKLAVKPGKYVASCPNCDYTYQYYRKPSDRPKYHARCKAVEPMTIRENK